MMNVTGSSAAPGRQRGVAADHLQHGGDQEQQPAERRVDHERHRVGRGELPGPEHPERQHRLRLLVLDPDEQAEQRRPHAQRHQHLHRSPAVRGGRDQPVGDPGQRAADAGRALDVQPRHGARRLGLRHVPGGDGQHDHGQRQVDEEHQPPRHRADQVPAEERTDRGGQRRPGPTRPRWRPRGPPRRRRPAGWPGCRGSAAPRRRPAGPGPRSAPARSGPARTAATRARTTRRRWRTSSAARSCRPASRRAAAARPGSACTRRPPTARWSRRRGSPARWRAARCRPRWRPGRRCPSPARWRPPPTGPGRSTSAGPRSAPGDAGVSVTAARTTFRSE